MVGSTRSRVSVFMSKFRKLGFIHYTRTGGLKIYRSLSQVLEE
jgi:CRP/FNR family cyclic AMP-dependent transcriptional regulator